MCGLSNLQRMHEYTLLVCHFLLSIESYRGYCKRTLERRRGGQLWWCVKFPFHTTTARNISHFHRHCVSTLRISFRTTSWTTNSTVNKPPERVECIEFLCVGGPKIWERDLYVKLVDISNSDIFQGGNKQYIKIYDIGSCWWLLKWRKSPKCVLR